jgi:hypothetical protein
MEDDGAAGAATAFFLGVTPLFLFFLDALHACVKFLPRAITGYLPPNGPLGLDFRTISLNWLRDAVLL